MENFKNLPIIKKLGFNRIVLVCVLILMYAAFSLLVMLFAGSFPISSTVLLNLFFSYARSCSLS